MRGSLDINAGTGAVAVGPTHGVGAATPIGLAYAAWVAIGIPVAWACGSRCRRWRRCFN